MTVEGVTVVCSTYARTRQLAECVECFKRQDYNNKLDMLVVNDCADQTITIPGVHVINVKTRFPNLGEKRNFAALEASKLNKTLCFVDDDDLFMPWYVRELVENMNNWGGRPIWPTKLFGMSGLAPGPFSFYFKEEHKGSFLMTHDQLVSVGGYPPWSTDEDTFVYRIAIEKWGCYPRHNQTKHTPGYVHRWANGVFHLCGVSPGDPTVWGNAGAHGQNMLTNGQEPVGDVVVIPKWEADYLTLASQYLKDNSCA